MNKFHAIELNDNKDYTKESTIRKDIKIIISNATIYIPSNDSETLKLVVRELNDAKPRKNR